MNHSSTPQFSRRQVLRGGAGLAGLAVLGSTLAACGSGGGSGAGRKDQIVMVNYPGWMGESEVADFKTKFGVKVREVTGLTDGGSASQAAQLVRNKGDYDMALSGNVLARHLEVASMIQEVDFDNIPNLSGVGERFRKEFTWGVPVEFGKLGIAYRKDLLPSPPESWAEMFDMAPKISRKFTFPDYDVDVMSMAILALGFDVNTADPKQIDAAKDMLVKSKPHLKAFLSTDASKPLIDGSVVLAVLHDYDMPAAMKANDKIGWISPSEGLPAYIDGWLALSGTKQTTSIEKFMNFHLDPKVYANFINATGAAFLLPEAEKYIDDAILTNPALKLDDSVKIQWQKFINADGVKLRNAAWDEIKAA